MTLHIKDSGSWEQVNEVHVNRDGYWYQCKEVYIKKNGQWEPILHEDNTQTITATGSGTIDVPAGAFKARVTLEGANGGKGGHDGNGPGGDGGTGTAITAVIDVDPFTTLSYNIASGGTNGSAGGGASGGSGGTGYANGGNGGRTGSAGWSGSGGGGGGASSLVAPDSNVLIVAGGGAGGGGSGNQASIGKSGRDAKDLDQVHNNSTSQNGQDGVDCGTADGGAGGGGGGGVSGISDVSKNTYSSTRKYESWGYQYKAYRTEFSTITSLHVIDRQSSSECILNYSYGISGSNVWVDNGCRARFRITGQTQTGSGGGYMGSYDSDGYPGEGGVSFVDLSRIPEYSYTNKGSTANGADGKLTITWLKEDAKEDTRTITTRYTHPFTSSYTVTDYYIDDVNGSYVSPESYWIVIDPPLPSAYIYEEFVGKDLFVVVNDDLVTSSSDQTQLVLSGNGKKYYRVGDAYEEDLTLLYPDGSTSSHTVYVYNFESVEDI